MSQDIKDAVCEALDSGWYILGEMVAQFERKFADFCGVKNAVCVSSGTASIFLSLLALGVEPGDEVIAPSFSFMATASPILHIGAKPIFVDITPRTYTLDPNEVEKKLSKRTKAIIPVHLYGHPADMDSILEIAEKNNLFVLEDACQAHGAKYKGRKVGGIGHVACFSFYPSKNMTVCGDGGIVTTDDEEVAEKIRRLRNHGRRAKYVHETLGYNLRFNEIQAAIGLKQLEKLPSWNENRRKIAHAYNESLNDLVITPIEERWAKHVYHMYVIRTEKRDALQEFLKKHGISTGIHYPIPIHKQPAVSEIVDSNLTLKNTEESAATVLSLPMYPQLTQSEVEYVCEKIALFHEKS
ncbi:erythromycin biosynthesis sensory transduction protein eryC1 [Candidatus Bathyarchaeota archaeon]|nr:MAG: erythromycin biosynthesis sensory transduction protein eryC1 [Candidatus Bathyarchaeota archaeon]